MLIKNNQKNKQLTEWLFALQKNATPDLNEAIDYLSPHLPLLNELKNTHQDPQWHAEGDVLYHTQLVLEQLYLLLENEAKHIEGKERQILILAAILHDIGKPLTTSSREIDGVSRIVSPAHEERGRSYLALRLLDLPLDSDITTPLLALVGTHQKPKFLIIRDQSREYYYQLARMINLELIYWLEVADMRGRISYDSIENRLEPLELFKLQAQEYELWGAVNFDQKVKETLLPSIQMLPTYQQTYIIHQAISQLCNGVIFQAEEALATTYIHRKQFAHLIIMCGISGSGKSTWIEKCSSAFFHSENKQKQEPIIISLDQLREEINGSKSSQKNSGQIIQLAKLKLKKALAEKRMIIWDATNLRIDYRSELYQLAKNYHALVTLIVIQKPIQLIMSSNRQRKVQVPDNVIQRQLNSFQWPTINETDEVIFTSQTS